MSKIIGKIFLAGQKLQQEKYERWMEAVGLPKGFCTVLGYPQDVQDALGLGFPQGKDLHNTPVRERLILNEVHDVLQHRVFLFHCGHQSGLLHGSKGEQPEPPSGEGRPPGGCGR